MKRSLRVLAVSDFYLPRRGGVERVVHETARRLPAHGIEVEVLTRRLDAAAVARETVDGIPIWRVGRGPGPLAVELLGLFPAVRAWARQELARFDLIHAHLTLTTLPLVLGGVARPPLVATFYGPWHREYLAESDDPSVPSRWPGPLRRRVRPLVAAALYRGQQRILAAAARRIVLSEHSRRELGEFGYTDPALSEVVPGGVDVERFCPRPAAQARRRLGLDPGAGPLLVSVRRLVPRMGLDLLIEAAARLQPSHPGLTLVVGGEGPLRSALEAQVERLGLGNRVRFLGLVDEESLPWLYAAADLVVVPTRALEGFGLPVLEAWACGVPVVGTGVGALEETVERLHPELVAPVATAADLAAAIERGLGLAGDALSERARDLALSYRWEIASAHLARLYHGVADGRRAA